MAAITGTEWSVIDVREKSAMVMCSASGARAAKSLSPNLDPRREAFRCRLAEPLDSYSKVFGNLFCNWATEGAIPDLNFVTAAGSISSKVTSAATREEAEPPGASLIASTINDPGAPASIHNSINFTWSDDNGRLPSL